MKKFVGTWNIIEMEQWDSDYINMETQAYFKVDKKGNIVRCSKQNGENERRLPEGCTDE